MTNQLFMSMSSAKKQEKLSAILQKRTRGALSKDELRQLLLAIRQNRQHKIIVHTSPQDYRRALMLTGSAGHGYRGRIILGKVHPCHADDCADAASELFNELRPAAAIIAAKTDMAGFSGLLSTVHIYIPKQLYQKRRGAGI